MPYKIILKHGIGARRKGDMSDMPSVQLTTHRAATHPPVGIEGVRTHAPTSLLRMSAGVLCLASNDHWCCTMCLGA